MINYALIVRHGGSCLCFGKYQVNLEVYITLNGRPIYSVTILFTLLCITLYRCVVPSAGALARAACHWKET
jgi:hypothetical protein